MASPDLLETRAKEAFIDDHFELAVDLYSQAITLSPNNAELYADRAQANIKLGNLTEAVSDANKAIELEPSLAKAYLRKGMACVKLEEYQTAKAALEVGATLAPGDSRFTNLIKECTERSAEEEAEGLLKESTDTTVKIEADTTPRDPKPVTSSSTHQTTAPVTKPKYRVPTVGGRELDLYRLFVEVTSCGGFLKI